MLIYAYIAAINFGFGKDTNDKHISTNIYFSGCSKEPKCPGCHNSILWNREEGMKVDLEKIKEMIKKQSILSTALVFLGGEPLDQELAVLELADTAKDCGMSTFLYTGKELKEVSNIIRDNIDVIISGPYIEILANPHGVWPASKNQVITRK